MLAHLPSRPLADWGKARAGDQMDVALWLYNRNGDTIFSRSSTCYVSRLMIGPEFSRAIISCSNGTDFHPKHNVNVEQALKLPIVYYQLSHQPGDRDALSLGLDHLMSEHGLSCGINSGTEFLSATPACRASKLCSIVECMLSLENRSPHHRRCVAGGSARNHQLQRMPAALANNIKLSNTIRFQTCHRHLCGHGFQPGLRQATLPGTKLGLSLLPVQLPHGLAEVHPEFVAATAMEVWCCSHTDLPP